MNNPEEILSATAYLTAEFDFNISEISNKNKTISELKKELGNLEIDSAYVKNSDVKLSGGKNSIYIQLNYKIEYDYFEPIDFDLAEREYQYSLEQALERYIESL